MLKLYNKEHEAIGALTSLIDYKIEYALTGEDKLEFSLSISDENISLVEEEGYVRNKHNEYVIKAIDPAQDTKRFSCIVNIEDIKAKSISSFDISNNNIDEGIRLALAGTGWILEDSNITKRRTVRIKNTNALDVLREIRKVFKVDFRFDAINKIVYAYEEFGSDKGVYFTDELNLIDLKVPSDTYDYVTKLIPRGKDGLTISSVNSGKEYVENFQYTNKVIELIWEDGRYTDAQSLKDDAIYKLNELSKPKRSYSANVTDLSSMSDEYSYLDFSIGDTVTLLSKSEKFKDNQRILKYIEYPFEPHRNTVEMGNTTLTFEELQQDNEYKNQVVDNITSDNGTVSEDAIPELGTDKIKDFETEIIKVVDLEAINGKFDNLEASNVTITGQLSAVEANIGTLNSNVANIDKLVVNHSAYIKDLQATSATITDLDVVNGVIDNLEATVAKINTLVGGNISGENIQAGGITSDKLTIANGFITNAMISNLDVSKVNAGDISTNKFRIKSDDGGIEIVGATQQFKDKNNRVRIQMGKDAQGNFNFIIRGEDGTSTLIDHTGVKQDAIADDLIISNMIASDAVGEKQINYSSFSEGFNKETNTTTLKATKIQLDNQNQSLELAFNSLKTQSDGTKETTESHSTTIGVMQGQISTAINNTTIVKDGQTILLKDDYNRTVQTVDSMRNTIGSHTTLINQHTGEITNVTTKTNVLERTVESLRSTLTSVETTVNDLEIGARNLLKNSKVNITSNAYPIVSLYFGEVKPIDGEEYIISIKGNLAESKSYFGIYNSGGSVQVTTILHSNKDSDGVYRKKFRWRINSANNTYISIYPIPSSVSSESIVEWVKLEKGNKATDWTPAPEDIDGAITDIDGKITTTDKKVSDIEQDLTKFKTTVSSTYTTQTEFLNLDGEVIAVEKRVKANESSITQLNNSITMKVWESDIITAIDKVKVGGTNIIKNSTFTKELENWTKSTQITTQLTTHLETHALIINDPNFLSSRKFVYQSIKGHEFKKGDEIVLSAYIYVESSVPMNSNGSIFVRFTMNDGTLHDYFNIKLDKIQKDRWIKIESKDVIRYDVKTNSGTIYPYASSQGKIRISKIMLEKGNKSTDWTPATEDIDGAIVSVQEEVKTVNDTVAQINVDLTGINSSVKDLQTTTTTLEKVTEKILINNFSRSGNKDRWSCTNTHINPSNFVGYYADIQTSGNVSMISNKFEVDSNKTYKLSLMMQFPTGNGSASFYFGVYAYDKNNTRVGVYLNTQTELNTNPYFYSNKLTTALSTWKTFEGYIYSHNADINEDTPKGNCHNFLRFNSNIKYLEFRFLHYRGEHYGDNQMGSMLFAHPTISEVDNIIVNTETRLKTAEQKILPGVIVSTVSEQIGEGGEINASTMWLNKNGFFVKTGVDQIELKQGYLNLWESNKMQGRMGKNILKFYNWWDNTNEEVTRFYSGRDSGTNAMRASVYGKHGASIGKIGQEVIKITTTPTTYIKSPLGVYGNLHLNGYDIANLTGINKNDTDTIWVNRMCLRSNQVNSNYSSGNMYINYWKGSEVGTNPTKARIANGANDGSHGYLSCGELKAYGTKNCVIETDIGDVGINAYETTEYYFGDIGETVIGSDGYSYVYIDPIFMQTVNTNVRYQVFLSIYGEGAANVVDRTPTYFKIKGTPSLTVGYELKAKRKGYEAHRLDIEEKEIKSTKIGLDEDYEHERNKFDEDIQSACNEQIKDMLENAYLIDLVENINDKYVNDMDLLEGCGMYVG